MCSLLGRARADVPVKIERIETCNSQGAPLLRALEKDSPGSEGGAARTRRNRIANEPESATAPAASKTGQGRAPRESPLSNGIVDNSLISFDFRKETGFGFRSIQLGFPSGWAWNSFSLGLEFLQSGLEFVPCGLEGPTNPRSFKTDRNRLICPA